MYNSFFSKLKVASAVIALFLAGCGDDEESVALQSINVLPSTVTLNPRQTEQLKAVAVPENATEVSFSWTSSNEAVATVSPTTGLVTAVAEGTATVNARSGNVKSKDVTVTVNLRVLESFTVTPNPLSLGLLDNPVQLVVTKTPADAGGSFTYDSDNDAIAEVDADGMVTAKGIGTTNVVVTSGSLPAVTVPVTVTPPALTGLTVTPEAINVAIIGATVPITDVAPVPPQAVVGTLTYATGNASVATVDVNGVVTITGAGTANITVTAPGNIEATVPVNVAIPTPDGTFDKDEWTATATSVWQDGYPASNLIDGDELNHWHSTPGSGVPVTITVDMKGNKDIKGIYLIHRPETDQPANPKAITIEVSIDAETWVQVYQTDNLSQEKTAILLELDQPVVARYFKVTITATNSGNDYTYLAEIGAYNTDEPYEPPVPQTGPIYPLTFKNGYNGVTITNNSDDDKSQTLTFTVVPPENQNDPQATTGAIGRALGGNTATLKFEYKNTQAIPYEPPTWGMSLMIWADGVGGYTLWDNQQLGHASDWTPVSIDLAAAKAGGFFTQPQHILRIDPANAVTQALLGYAITIRKLRIETDE